MLKFVLKCLFESYRCNILKLIQFFPEHFERASVSRRLFVATQWHLQDGRRPSGNYFLYKIEIEIYRLKIEVKNQLFDTELQADDLRNCTEHVGWDVGPI